MKDKRKSNGGKLAALTGAGISQQSGIPTFVEIPGLRDKLSRDYYYQNRRDFFDTLIGMRRTCEAARPNQAHLALAKRKVPVITMNVDGLHVIAGSEGVCEIHGNLRDIFCIKCGLKHDYKHVEKSLYCRECGSDLNPDVVLYGDSIPRLNEAFEMVKNIDVLLVVGTSFYTSTASYVVNMAKQCGADVELINEDAARKVPEFLERFYGNGTL